MLDFFFDFITKVSIFFFIVVLLTLEKKQYQKNIMLRSTPNFRMVPLLPTWMRTKKKNLQGCLPPRDFALKELKREEAAVTKWYKQEFYKMAVKPDPTNIKSYSFLAFGVIVLPYALYQQRRKWKTLEDIVGLDIDEDILKAGDLEALDRQRDPNRPPWPLLHFNVVEMREGKRSLDQIGDVWHQTYHFYPNDWLIPIEMVQILKYNSPLYLSQFVADPEQLRKEVHQQLVRLKNQKVTRKFSHDVLEIVRAACEDIAALDFRKSDSVPLVPINT